VSGVTGLDSLRVNPDWASLPLFDRTGWRRLPFGAFADSINVRVEPSDAADEIYVGLDDLDSGDLDIRRWGKGSDVIGTKLRFRKGDIIFGRRRAYQRKLAVAEFDGICSAHAMVVRAKPEIVLPEFLPFLMMSDGFMTRAVEISVGSLSPTINWTTLKVQEFDLPPFGQQRRVADVFRAVQRQAAAYRIVHDAVSVLRAATFAAALSRFEQGGGAYVPLESVCIRTAQSGLYKGPEFIGKGTKTVHMGELFAHDVIGAGIEMSRTLLTERERNKYALLEGDLLFGRRSIVLEGAGKCCLVGPLDEPVIFESSILRVTPDQARVLPPFLFEWFRSSSGRAAIKRIRSFTTISGITGSALNSMAVPCPALAEQLQIIESLAVATTVAGAVTESGLQLQRFFRILAGLLEI